MTPKQVADALVIVDGVASRSPSTGRKVGAIALTDDGYYLADCNNSPVGVKLTPERLEGEARYRFLEHAERNIIAKAAFQGMTLRRATWVMRWFPCVDCARAIAISGALKLFCSEPDWSEERYHFRDAETILRESGVEIEFLEKQGQNAAAAKSRSKVERSIPWPMPALKIRSRSSGVAPRLRQSRDAN